MFAKPAPDPNRPGEVLRVLDPMTKRPICRDGQVLPDITYWHQRLNHADIVLCEPPASDEPKQTWPDVANAIVGELHAVVADSGAKE